MDVWRCCATCLLIWHNIDISDFCKKKKKNLGNPIDHDQILDIYIDVLLKVGKKMFLSSECCSDWNKRIGIEQVINMWTSNLIGL